MATDKVQLGEEPTWELVYKRNKVERLKDEKDPMTVREELPEFVEDGYEAIPEEDIVRLYWWGVAHDKPKVGTFMVRMKVPSGRISPDELRGVGKISEKYGDNYSELTTRMGIQLHNVELEHLGDTLDAIEEVGLTTAGAEGDTVRNVTGCPVADIDPHALFDVTPKIDEVHEYFGGNPEYSDLPRKLKFTLTACPMQCSGPEFHGVGLIAAEQDGQKGFGVVAGGGLSSTPRMARDLGIFVPWDDTIPVLEAITNAWQEDLRYRKSRAKSRIKFMVDDYGPEAIREKVEQRVGKEFEDFEAPEPAGGDSGHLGINEQKQEGKYYIGYSVPQAWVMGDQLQALADVVDDVDGDVRFTRLQNFLLANIPEDEVDRVVDEVEEIGFPLDRNELYGHSVACTSHQYCNYSVTETKGKADEILDELTDRFGRDVEDLTVFVDGCPHACAHHWMGNIGLQGTTARGEDGKIEAYDITVDGGLGDDADIGKPLFRRVPHEDANEVVHRLVEAWLEERYDRGASNGDYTFKDFAEETSDAELKAIGLDKDEIDEEDETHVTLRLTGPLLDYTGGIENLETRAVRAHDVGRLIELSTRRYTALQSQIIDEDGELTDNVNLFLNEEDIRSLDGLDTELEAGDEVMALPALSGG
ncbi:MAG: MoaD/ThiS family protein [Bradymonadaceae bacterium]